jgi:hypothetical protein
MLYLQIGTYNNNKFHKNWNIGEHRTSAHSLNLNHIKTYSWNNLDDKCLKSILVGNACSIFLTISIKIGSELGKKYSVLFPR